MAVTLFGGLLDILRISNPLASNPSYHKLEWIRSTGGTQRLQANWSDAPS
jgi:hypothetical protein